MDILLEKTLHLNNKDDRSNILLSFTVPHDYDRLEISCSYTTKYITEPAAVIHAVQDCYERYLRPQDRPEQIDPAKFRLNNLLTLSLDREEHYIGAAHRQAPVQKHIISARYASPGFWKCPVKAGAWRAVINVHALAAGKVDYNIRVVGKGENEI